MQVLQPRDKLGWVTVIIADRWCQAKIYNVPSRHGINGGRISKLCVSKTDKWNGLSQADYNFSRGLDFDTLFPGTLCQIIASLSVL